VFSEKVNKTQQQISPSINGLLFKLTSAVIYENNCRDRSKQKFWIRHMPPLDFKYPSDFRFLKKCQISSGSDSQSITLTSLPMLT